MDQLIFVSPDKERLHCCMGMIEKAVVVVEAKTSKTNSIEEEEEAAKVLFAAAVVVEVAAVASSNSTVVLDTVKQAIEERMIEVVEEMHIAGEMDNAEKAAEVDLLAMSCLLQMRCLDLHTEQCSYTKSKEGCEPEVGVVDS